MDFGFTEVGAIVVICYLLAEILKQTNLNNKWLPAICGLCGAILGILAFVFKMPDFPGQDIFTAIAIGIVSGLASTGLNQLAKQLTKEE